MTQARYLASFVFALSAFLTVVTYGQSPAIPPSIVLFEEYDEKLATLTVSQTVMAEVAVTEKRVNAAGVEEEVVMRVPETRVQMQKYLLADAKIRTVGGRELDRKEAARQLKKKQPIILLSVLNKLPDAYKSLFRDEAVIIELTALGTVPDLDGVKPVKKP